MKKYEYTFRNTPGDYFLYRMGNIYSSPRALVNVIFTVAIIVLIAAKWTGTNWLGHLIMVVMLLIFPVFQPLFSYFASIRDAVSIRVDTTLTFDEDGMKIHVYKHSQHIRWRGFLFRKETQINAARYSGRNARLPSDKPDSRKREGRAV